MSTRIKDMQKAKYKSPLEELVADTLLKYNCEFGYESQTYEYTQVRKYTPDFFIIRDDGSLLIIEAKGKLDKETRRKHLDMKKQHPDLDIHFVFQRDNKLVKGGRMKYSDWANKHGFKWAIKKVPISWLS